MKCKHFRNSINVTLNLCVRNRKVNNTTFSGTILTGCMNFNLKKNAEYEFSSQN